ncbi:MAG: hypothetical protein JW871_04250 [Endomicrobiales bacterium]|nr:hypothetical protein [Endomicrobiales bacterium]
MGIDAIRQMLLWCALINMGLLLFSFLVIVIGNKLIYKIHSQFIKISEETFNTVMYSLIGFYKILIFVFNIVPYVALTIIK